MKLNQILMGLALGAASMMAGPTVELVPNVSQNRVVLAGSFVSALGTLGVTPGGLETGNLTVSGGVATATFGIPSARIDGSNLRLQILHTGGLSLRAGSTFVRLSDFIVENLAGGPRLTGLVTVNETIVGRIPLFTITLGGAPEVKSFDSTTDLGTAGTIVIRGRLNLTDTAARALNGVFGVTAFVRDFLIGEATVSGTYVDGAN
jgi:hypothetical protein